jgi:hypothetical protein
MIGTGFIFGCQVLKIRQKQMEKKMPHYTKQESDFF